MAGSAILQISCTDGKTRGSDRHKAMWWAEQPDVIMGWQMKVKCYRELGKPAKVAYREIHVYMPPHVQDVF